MSVYSALRSEAKEVEVFEIEGLGKGPFKLVGFEENWFVVPGVGKKPGGTCDRCGNSIASVFKIQSADGNKWNIGCDCIRKLGLKKLHSEALAAERRRRNAVRHEAEQAKRKSLADEVANTPFADWLKSQPHPRSWLADRGETLYDSLQWSYIHCGFVRYSADVADAKSAWAASQVAAAAR